MKRPPLLFFLYSLYKWFVFIPLMTLSMVFFSTMAITFSVLGSPNLGYWGGILWSRFCCILTPVTLRKSGMHHVRRDQTYVLVANHQSYYDVLVLVGYLPLNLKWVMKQELRKIPVFGYACEKVGHIFVDRSNRKAALASVEKAKATIQNGSGIMFMPEGTRSTDGKLLPFKKGAFRFALDIGLPIVPVTIAGTHNILPTGTLDLYPGPASITIHEPIDPTPYGEERIDELIELVRLTISVNDC